MTPPSSEASAPSAPSAAPAGWWQRTAVTLEMIKVSHSLFALPFALGTMLLAAGGRPAPAVVGWVLVAMVAARSAAMAFNRLVDARFDASNPRTRDRALPAGRVSANFVRCFVLASCALFVLAAGMLNPLCLALSPIALLVVLGYSLSKRFTSLCHLWLGAALGLTPLAGWVAVRGSVDGSVGGAAWLALAVMFWVAGFDVIYACQDARFDRATALNSLPARLGIRNALLLAALFHGLAVALFVLAGWSSGFGWYYRVGVLLVGTLLVVEHVLAWPGRGQRLQVAFFHVNSLVGLVMLFAILGEIYW